MSFKKKSIVIALAGHPNSGKTTLFNALTNSHTPVGNWCGVTVEPKRAQTTVADLTLEWVDLPGCYNLDNQETTSLDEQLAKNYLHSLEADLIIHVIDETHLARELPFTLLLLEKNCKVLVVLNKIGANQTASQNCQTKSLSTALGCPVIALVAVEKQAKEILTEQILNTLCIERPETNLRDFPTKDRLSYARELAETYAGKRGDFNTGSQLDKIVLHPLFGMPILFLLMYLAFGITVYVGGSIQTFFSTILQYLFIDKPAELLHFIQAPPWGKTLFIEGLGMGLVTTFSFIPVIGGMFFCLSFLETSGYMARAAFVMDKTMKRIGLSGKSFIPMILGFGCNVPAILATRTLKCKKQRILTILMTPFMSCGARLAIYALFVSAFFKDQGHHIIFSLYCIGILMALLTGFVLTHTLLISEKAESNLELPAYRFPGFKTMWRIAKHRTLTFVVKAGLIIIPLCILISSLSCFKMNGNQSFLVEIGQFCTPILEPIGIQETNWPALVGLMTGVIAKEVVVGTLTALYAGAEGIGNLATHFPSGLSAYAYLLFVLLYFPCVSVLATIARELNVAWALFSAVWTTGMAYFVAVLFYQTATFADHPLQSLIWVGIIGITAFLVWQGLRFVGFKLNSKTQNQNRTFPTRILVYGSDTEV